MQAASVATTRPGRTSMPRDYRSARCEVNLQSPLCHAVRLEDELSIDGPRSRRNDLEVPDGNRASRRAVMRTRDTRHTADRDDWQDDRQIPDSRTARTWRSGHRLQGCG